VRAQLKAAIIVFWIVWCIPFVGVFHGLRMRRAQAWCVITCYRGLCRIIGLHVHAWGKLAQERPLLLVSNHISYLDILMLGSLYPVRFTPKSEIAGWPGVSLCCRLSRCLFIDRKASRTADNMLLLKEALKDGSVISLFPEGTTSDGKRVLPFRSSYFSLAEQGVAVQPAAIVYRRVNGLPVDTRIMPKIAWYGDMELAPHLLGLLSLRKIEAELILHPVIALSAETGRKDLAIECQRIISKSRESLP
jgi:1-acyl-sn-glycerol-3-phosphate acyltransferase